MWKSTPAVALLMALGLTTPARGETPSAAPLAPSSGDVIPAFEAQGLDGKAQQVSFPKGSSTVLGFFLPGAFERKPGQLRMIGVIMDQEPPGFFSAMPVSFPVVRSPGRSFVQSLKVNRVPLTLRVAAGGKVEDVGVGLLDPIRLGEFFHP